VQYNALEGIERTGRANADTQNFGPAGVTYDLLDE
jgi:hypothetical protein